MARQIHVAFIGVSGVILLGCLLLVACSSPEERFAEKIEQANENLEKGQTQKAIKILEALKVEYPGRPQVLENLAFAFIAEGDYFTGAFYFNQLAQSFPENMDYYLYAAEAWIKAGDPESAIRDYEAYLLENKTDWNTWQKIGDLYLSTNQRSKAIHAYSNSSNIRFNPELELRASLLANETGNLRQAEAGFERLLMVDDAGIAEQGHVGLLQIKHKRRQWEEVAKLMDEIKKRFPNTLNSTALAQIKADYENFNQARMAEQKKIDEEEERRKRLIEEQRERAERLAAARRAPTQPPVQTEDERPPGELAIRTEEEPPTTAEIAPLPPPVRVEPQPRSAMQTALEAARRIASTNSPNAVALYWDAINLGDESGVAFYELSRVYFNRNEFNESEMTSLEALRRAPDNSTFLLSYLNTIRKTKAKPDVVAEIHKYRSQFPQNADLVLLLARIYAEPGGDLSAARRYYNQFIQMAPNHPEINRARYEVRGI